MFSLVREVGKMNQVATVSTQNTVISCSVPSSKIVAITAIAVFSLLAGFVCFANLPDATVLKPFAAVVIAQSSIVGTMLVTLAKQNNKVGKAWTYGLMTEAAVLFAVGALLA